MQWPGRWLDVTAMTWGFTLWGQPPSVNRMYEPAWKTANDGRMYKGKRLSDVAAKYRDDAVLIIQAAKPSGWAPEGQVRIYWAFYLNNETDCDNAMKLIHDAIQKATGIDDKRYLPCVLSKEIRLPARKVRVEIIVDEVRGSLLSDLATLRSIRTP